MIETISYNKIGLRYTGNTELDDSHFNLNHFNFVLLSKTIYISSTMSCP